MNKTLLSIVLLFFSLSSFGQGFPTTAVNYSLPTGGYISSSHNYGYFNLAETGSYDSNSNGWSIMDMNNDQKPDLVVTSKGTGTYRDCFGLPSSQYWKVYLNNGTSYSTTPINWTLPTGGYYDGSHLYGYFSISTMGSYHNSSNGWNLMDMNNDHLPDLVVVCQGNGTYRNCFGLPSSQYWKVYAGSATGFSTTAVNWSLPTGGYNDGSHLYGYFGTDEIGGYYQNCNGWSVIDFNNDNKPDLVVTSEGTGTFKDCFGLPNNQYWKVYLNNGAGFNTTPINWTLPSGGYTSSGHNYGYFATSGDPYYGNLSNGWSLSDLNNDHLIDLVVTTIGDGTYANCFGVGSSPYWKVYYNTGNGFNTNAVNWTLPAGGYLSSGHLYGYNMLANTGSYDVNSNGWSVIDINGDNKSDLVLFSQGTGTYRDCFGVPNNQYWKVFLNSFSPTALNESSVQFNGISLAPNPAYSTLNITADYSIINQKYSVFSSTGVRVLEGVFSNNEEALYISSLSSGIYLLQVGTVSSNTIKFIKE